MIFSHAPVHSNKMTPLPKDFTPGPYDVICARGKEAKNHPGNIFYHDDGTVTFIDCGMTGHVESETSVQLAQLVQAVVAGDARRVVQVALAISGADPLLEFDRKMIAKQLTKVGEPITQ